MPLLWHRNHLCSWFLSIIDSKSYTSLARYGHMPTYISHHHIYIRSQLRTCRTRKHINYLRNLLSQKVLCCLQWKFEHCNQYTQILGEVGKDKCQCKHRVHWREVEYLHDSFIYWIVVPFFPIMHPIFQNGTLTTDNISSSGTFPLAKKSPDKIRKPK